MMASRQIRLAGAALLLGTLGPAPSFAQTADRAAGEQIAARECAGCHGTGGAKGVTIKGVFVPSFSEIARRPNQSRERLQSFLTIPRHPMPGLALETRELRDLAEYIISFRD